MCTRISMACLLLVTLLMACIGDETLDDADSNEPERSIDVEREALVSISLSGCASNLVLYGAIVGFPNQFGVCCWDTTYSRWQFYGSSSSGMISEGVRLKGHGDAEQIYFRSSPGTICRNGASSYTVGGTYAGWHATLEILGEGGNDTVTAMCGEGNTSISTRISGGDGNDTLTGCDLNDYLDGWNGNDILSGLGGADTILGYTGNDTIDGGTGMDILAGEVGTDYITGGEGNDDIYGGTEPDTLLGGGGNDTIDGEAGDDTLRGESGDDTLRGDDGSDHLYGGSDNDHLYGENGGDFLFGDDGVDTMSGGAGTDYMEGGIDDDSMYGDADNDQIYGQDGNDYCNGGTHTSGDHCDGGNGLDDCDLWETQENCEDVINATTAECDSFDGQIPIRYGQLMSFPCCAVHYDDIAFACLQDGIWTMLGRSTGLMVEDYPVIFIASDEAERIYSLYGATTVIGDGDDQYSLYGWSPDWVGTYEIWGGGGDDEIECFWWGLPDESLNCEVHGGEGDDDISGGTWNDFLYGDGGDDMMTDPVNDVDTDYYEGGEGNDVITCQHSYCTAHGGPGNDIITTGNVSAYLYGEAGDDFLGGASENDTLDGGDGSGDRCYGYRGTDTCIDCETEDSCEL